MLQRDRTPCIHTVDTKNTIKMDYMCTSCEYKVNTYAVNTKREININTNRNMFHSRINRTLDPDEDVLTTLKTELHEGNILLEWHKVDPVSDN